jgi:hypothetical protein
MIAASSGNFLPTFRYNLSVPSTGIKNPKERINSRNTQVLFILNIKKNIVESGCSEIRVDDKFCCYTTAAAAAATTTTTTTTTRAGL